MVYLLISTKSLSKNMPFPMDKPANLWIKNALIVDIED